MHCGIQGRGISTLSMVDESVKAEREETKSDVHKKGTISKRYELVKPRHTAKRLRHLSV